MADIKQGTVTLTIPDSIQIPERAGKMTAEEVARLEKPRRGLGMTCNKTADALALNADRLTVKDVDPQALKQAGHAADAIDDIVTDVDHLLSKLKQANTLLDADAHRMLRKVLAALRSEEKFDPTLGDLFQPLITYFANARRPPDEPEGTPE